MKSTSKLDELYSFLLEEEETDPLYHVTFYNRLEEISDKGLQPGSSRSIGGFAYNAHAAKGIFLSEQEGVSFWYDMAERYASHYSDNPYEDEMVPVVLRIDYEGLQSDLEEDELGGTDSKHDAYIHNGPINPEYLEVWDGSSWISVDDYSEIDLEQAFDMESIEDEDGEDEKYYLFRYDNPLQYKA